MLLQTSLLAALLVLADRVTDPAVVTTASLLNEMSDLSRLATLDGPKYSTIQWSSYDRRSRGPDEPGWFGNSDGFGGEPIPAFAATLKEPDSSGVGLYLLGEATGPGAIVRGWSAGMGGILRVVIDGASEPLFEGPGQDFLCRRSEILLARAGNGIACGDLFRQVDADYLPIPFAKSLRVTWEGKLSDIHFYHVGVRLYAAGVVVRSFDAKRDLAVSDPALRQTLERMARTREGDETALNGVAPVVVPAGGKLDVFSAKGESGLVKRVVARVLDADGAAALRGTLFRIRFDDSERAQVESPLGDFFGAGPGVHPYESLPFCVKADGTMICRFFMPYRRSVTASLFNSTQNPVSVAIAFRTETHAFTDSSLYFHARWRVDPDLDTREPQDLPFLIGAGRGRVVGVAVQLMNPSPVPTPGGDWWGEGDEKIFLDDDATPSTFGTGSEDYFNYSWSRPDLFTHPYCAQPLCSGPGTSGYVTNLRFHVLDDLPFEHRVAFYMELRHHHALTGLSYGRIVYAYARPGFIDDHRPPQGRDFIVPVLPQQEPAARGGATGATFVHAEDVEVRASEGDVMTKAPCPIASRGRVLLWSPTKAGSTLELPIDAKNDGPFEVHVVVLQSQDAATIHATLDAISLAPSPIVLATAFERQLRSVDFDAVDAKAGKHVLNLVAEKPGAVAIDYLWLREPR